MDKFLEIFLALRARKSRREIRKDFYGKAISFYTAPCKALRNLLL